MISNRITVVGVALACVASAGAGSYFATRQGVAGLASPTAVASSAPTSTTTTDSVVPAEAVEAAPRADVRTTTAPPPAAPAPPAAIRVEARPRARTPKPPSEPATARPVEQARASEPAVSPTSSRVPAVEPATETQPAPARAEERPSADAWKAPQQPAHDFEELVVAADSVIGLETDTVLSSAVARVEDRVEARVVRDVRVGGDVAIPAGTRAIGSVVIVERGGRFRERARLGIRFQTLVMADGGELPISTETIYRFGNAPSNASAQRIGGGAVIGAIIGGIVGGGKGAAIGATAGAGAGTASVMTSDRTEATFPAGAEVTARVLDPIVVTVEKD